MIHLLRTVDESEKNVIINAHLENKDIQHRASLIKILNRCGSLDYALRCSQQYVTTAIGALHDLKQNTAREALIEVAEFMANRTM